MCSEEQRGVDGALDVAFADVRLNDVFAEGKAIGRSLDADAFQVVELGPHGQQLALSVGLVLQHLAYIKASKTAGLLAAIDHGVQRAGAQISLVKQGRKRIAAGDRQLLPLWFSRSRRLYCNHWCAFGGISCLLGDVQRLGQCDCVADQGVQLFRRLGQ